MNPHRISVKIGWEPIPPGVLASMIATLTDLLGPVWVPGPVWDDGNYIYFIIDCRVGDFDLSNKMYVQGLAAGFLAANGVEII